MKPILPTAIAAAVLAGAAVAQVSAIQPGQWETSVTITSVDMPGAPPEMAKMMIGRTTTVKQCLTPEQAARGPQDMLKGNKSCEFTHYSIAGGRLSSEMVCRQGGGTMTATSSGSFTPTSYTATGKVVVSGGAAMTMTSTTSGRRTGECH